MKSLALTLLCIGTWIALVSGCDSEDQRPPEMDFSGRATLNGSRLKIDITINGAQDKAGFEALGEHTSYWGGSNPEPISVPVERLEIGAKTVSVKGGATVREIPIEAKVAWVPSAKAAEEAEQSNKGLGLPHAVTFSSPSLGPDITVSGNLRDHGVVLINLRAGEVQGRPVVVKNNAAWLQPSYLLAFRDHPVEDLLPNGPLQKRTERLEVEIPAMIDGWFGERSTHPIKLSMELEAAHSHLRDELRTLAEKGGTIPGWTGGRAVFIGSDRASDGLVVGKARTFADLGFVAWVAAAEGAGRKIGSCRYEGRSLDHMVKDAQVTLRSLADGSVVAEGILKGRAVGCPSTVYSSEPGTVILSRPSPRDAERWALKNLPNGR